jgi:hypothetical protein
VAERGTSGHGWRAMRSKRQPKLPNAVDRDESGWEDGTRFAGCGSHGSPDQTRANQTGQEGLLAHLRSLSIATKADRVELTFDIQTVELRALGHCRNQAMSRAPRMAQNKAHCCPTAGDHRFWMAATSRSMVSLWLFCSVPEMKGIRAQKACAMVRLA